MTDVWQKVLNLAVGPRDDFLELGGDSLAAMQISLGLEEVLGVRVSAHTIIRLGTIEKISALLERRLKRQRRVSTGHARFGGIAPPESGEYSHGIGPPTDLTVEDVSTPETDSTRYKIVVNDAGQYSIWPSAKAVPLGWISAGFHGSRSACLRRVGELWVDIVPASTRDDPTGTSRHRTP